MIIEVTRTDWRAHLRAISECLGRNARVGVRAEGLYVEELAEVNMPEADVVELVGRSGDGITLRITKDVVS